MQQRIRSSRVRQARCMIGSEILLSIAVWLLVLTASPAADLTYKEYEKAAEPWKRGFVFGISRYMSTVAQPDEEAPYPVRAAFQRCLAAETDVLLVRQVEAYVAKNPAGAKGPMVTVVARALFDLCRSEIEKVKSPELILSPR